MSRSWNYKPSRRHILPIGHVGKRTLNGEEARSRAMRCFWGKLKPKAEPSRSTSTSRIPIVCNSVTGSYMRIGTKGGGWSIKEGIYTHGCMIRWWIPRTCWDRIYWAHVRISARRLRQENFQTLQMGATKQSLIWPLAGRISCHLISRFLVKPFRLRYRIKLFGLSVVIHVPTYVSTIP
jgi:hypothetical protein